MLPRDTYDVYRMFRLHAACDTSKQCAFSEPISSVESTIYRGWQGEVVLRVGHITGCTILDTLVCVVHQLTLRVTQLPDARVSNLSTLSRLHMSPCDILPAPLNRVKDVCSICGTLIMIPKADATRSCGKTVREALGVYRHMRI